MSSQLTCASAPSLCVARGRRGSCRPQAEGAPGAQVCSYRCIVTYESRLLEDFSLCILQKNNCLGMNAQIPQRPAVEPMTEFQVSPPPPPPPPACHPLPCCGAVWQRPAPRRGSIHEILHPLTVCAHVNGCCSHRLRCNGCQALSLYRWLGRTASVGGARGAAHHQDVPHGPLPLQGAAGGRGAPAGTDVGGAPARRGSR